MKIFVLGKGFISDHFNYPKITERLNYSDIQIESIIDRYKPDVIINCIAKTGIGNTDWCSSNKELTYNANTILPVLLSRQCVRHSIHMVHISTGSIFNDCSPNYINDMDLGWMEEDQATPQSFYEHSKYIADLAIKNNDNTTILRIKLPISTVHHPKNLITKLISYPKLIDAQNSMTFVWDFVDCVDWVIKNNICGVYHVANPGTLSAVDVMEEYRKHNPNHTFEVISEKELEKLTIEKRSNSVLNSDKLINAGFEMKPAKIALVEYMTKYFNIGD